MKHVPSHPSRSQLLSWINSHVERSIGPVRRIEELGNGAALLFLVSSLRPGVIRTDKIVKFPANQHECMFNLRMLASSFQKLQLTYRLQIDKLAQMKFQDNYAIACYLQRTLTLPHEERPAPPSDLKDTASHQRTRPRVKLIPPEKPLQPALRKEQPTVNNEDLDELQSNSHRKLKDIQCVIKETRSDREKLDKIAAILNLHGKQPSKSTATMTQDQLQPNALSIEASYKRFLRPSVCERSSFLNKKLPLSFQRDQLPNPEASFPRKVETELIPPSNEFEGEMLLSQKKDPESQKQEQEKVERVEQAEVEKGEAETVEGVACEEAVGELYPSL